MPKFLKTLFVFALLLIGFQVKSAFANTCMANVTAATWGNSSTWANCGGALPAAGDNVVASSTIVVTLNVNVNTASLNSIDLTGLTTGGGKLTGASTITVRGTTASTQNITWGGVGNTWTGTLGISNVSSTANINLTTNALLLNSVTFSGTAGSTTTLIDNLSLSALKTDVVTVNVSGAFVDMNGKTISGNSDVNRVLITSGTLGTATTKLNLNGGAFANADFRDIDLGSSTNLSAITGNSGDCGGNSNITFTTGVQLYWRSAASGSWSTAANWDTNPSATSRVPLCQDDVSFSASAGGVNLNSAITVTIDMPRVGRNIDFTGMTNTGTKPIISFGTIGTITGYGSLTLLSTTAMTWTVGSSYILEGRANGMPVGGWVITSAGQTAFFGMTQNAVGGTYKLGDALTISSSWTHAWGNFDANGFNVTAPGYNANTGDATSAKTITMGSGTWTLTGTAFLWQISASNTLVATGSTLIFSNVTATSKTFTGSSKTYGTVTFSGQNIIVTGNNTLTTLNLNNATTSTASTVGAFFTGASTTTITSSLTSNGSAGVLAIASSTTASIFEFKYTGAGTACTDFIKLSRSLGTPAATWYAGANSTDAGNNSGWSFTACPAAAASSPTPVFLRFD